ncbi:hypothetical protein LINPERPRIM_LOCUS39714 [Linum perenne]
MPSTTTVEQCSWTRIATMPPTLRRCTVSARCTTLCTPPNWLTRTSSFRSSSNLDRTAVLSRTCCSPSVSSGSTTSRTTCTIWIGT